MPLCHPLRSRHLQKQWQLRSSMRPWGYWAANRESRSVLEALCSRSHGMPNRDWTRSQDVRTSLKEVCSGAHADDRPPALHFEHVYGPTIGCWRASSTSLRAPSKLCAGPGVAIWFRILVLNVFEVVEERGSILSARRLQDIFSLGMGTAASMRC